MRAIALALVAGILGFGALSTTAQGQTRTFLRLDGIPGESTDDSHAGEIDIETFGFSVDQTGIRMAGGKATPARSRFAVINLAKRIDRSSPQLFLKCALGDAIPSATITVQRNAGGQAQDFFTVTLRNVIVASFSSTTGTEVFENVGLSYKVIEFTYRPQNQDGSLGAAITTVFDVNRNRIPIDN